MALLMPLLRSLLVTSIAFAFPPVHAQYSDIKLNTTYVNDFNVGYDRDAGLYYPSALEEKVFSPPSRRVHVDVCEHFPDVHVKWIPVEDGHHCPTANHPSSTFQVVPGTVRTLIFSAWQPGRVARIERQVANVRIDAEKQRPLLQGCKALQPREIWRAACHAYLDIPVGDELTNVTPTTRVRMDLLDGEGNLLRRDEDLVKVPAKIPLVVAVGDSYASGEGNPDKEGKSVRHIHEPTSQRDCKDDTTVMIARDTLPDMNVQPYWFNKERHLSLKSGPARAVKQLLAEDWPYIAYLSYATSGAKVAEIVQQLAEVKIAVGNRRIDALILSAGGNDAGFGDTLPAVAKDDFLHMKIDEFDRELPNVVNAIKRDEYPKFTDALANLGLNVGAVLMTQYPGHLFDRDNGKPGHGCGVFDTIGTYSVTKYEAEVLQKAVNTMNSGIASFVASDKEPKEIKWYYVSGIASDFSKHGYCSSRSYYVGAEYSCDRQGDFRGTMHPNAAGTGVYAKHIARYLRQVVPKSGRVSASPE